MIFNVSRRMTTQHVNISRYWLPMSNNAHEFNICRFFSTSIGALQHRSTFLNVFCTVQAKMCQHIQHMQIFSTYIDASQHMLQCIDSAKLYNILRLSDLWRSAQSMLT
jgi:hypothetical protein